MAPIVSHILYTAKLLRFAASTLREDNAVTLGQGTISAFCTTVNGSYAIGVEAVGSGEATIAKQRGCGDVGVQSMLLRLTIRLNRNGESSSLGRRALSEFNTITVLDTIIVVALDTIDFHNSVCVSTVGGTMGVEKRSNSRRSGDSCSCSLAVGSDVD